MRLGLVVVLVLVASCGGSNATIECAPDELACGDVCIDPTNDHDHCGQCDLACAAEQVCGNGTCAATCPDGQVVCDGACADPQVDEDNCGACGTTCTADQECRDGSCQVRCDVGLVTPIADPWGAEWDGVERAAATLADAEVACKGFGARLPTPTELFRVSATQSAAIGTAALTKALWSGAPADRTTQTALRLSDGTASEPAITSLQAYRCVCAPPQPAFFSGTRCFGLPGAECVAVGRTNIDAKDRPAIRRSSAIWECAREKAHLADLPAVVNAIFAGVPGSGVAIATADRSDYRQSSTVKWTVATGWLAQGNVGETLLQTAAPFRCTGSAFVSGTHPNPVLNEYVGQGGIYKSDAVDAAAAGWAAAHDACFAKGGHLPRAAELAELILQGLPNGANTFQWTSDQVGYDGMTNFLAATVRWPGTDVRFPYQYNSTTTWDFKNGSYASRCIYYPIDPTFQPPETCNTSCFDVAAPVGPARMVFDANDRAAARPEVAFATCAAAGGRLASERDLTEAIRKGLPNGSNAWIFTSDAAQNRMTVVRWNGVVPGFTDQYSAYMNWANLNTAHPYRCVWGNEVR